VLRAAAGRRSCGGGALFARRILLHILGVGIRVDAVQAVGPEQLVQVNLFSDVTAGGGDESQRETVTIGRGRTLRSASPRMLAMPELLGMERSALLPIMDV
jgi:hypothetical protein